MCVCVCVCVCVFVVVVFIYFFFFFFFFRIPPLEIFLFQNRFPNGVQGSKQEVTLNLKWFTLSRLALNLPGVSIHLKGLNTAVKRLPVLHHSADYILFLLESLGPLWYFLKVEFCSCIR